MTPAKNHPWRKSYDPSGISVKTKICDGCFVVYSRPEGISTSQWATRKYCTHECYMKINNTLKHPKKMTTLYAFTGKKESGKSTAATYVAEKTGAIRINFKDAIETEMRKNFPDLLEEIVRQTGDDEYPIKDGEKFKVDDLFKYKPPLMRALMQNYGTEVRRGDNPDYWADKYFASLCSSFGTNNIVTDDVRFLNEAVMVKQVKDHKIIRIIRSDINYCGNHESETQMDLIEVDYTVEVEKGDLEGMYKQLDAII